MPVQKIPFYTLSLHELAETLVNDGFEKFRARQIFSAFPEVEMPMMTSPCRP